MEKYNILIAEDHVFTRQTLVYELKKEGMNILGAFENGAMVLEFVRKNTPDVILMDISMPVMDGIEAAREIKRFNADIPIIMLTNHNEKEKVFGAFSSGANGYCIKTISIKELIKVMEIVCNGGIWFDKQIAAYIYGILKNAENIEEESKKTLKDYNITTRERNVLKLVSDGLSNKEIADKLVISQNTVRNHVASIIAKFSLKDRAQVAIFTLKNNLLDL